MFDLHYDLLTYILINKLNIGEVKKHCKEIFSNNITGGIFNLFYMSPKEMKEELDINYDDINIIKNLIEVNKLIKQYELIPKHVKAIYGIEGLDYLKQIRDLETIYKLGVRSVNIVWNNDNKFGGGARGDEKQGLTLLGEKLVKKLVKLNIAIDLSHANEKTFYDIIYTCNKLKEKGEKPIVFASHSNSKTVCNVQRNLSDEQILEIKKLNGVIGVVEIKKFCKTLNGKWQDENETKEYRLAYLKHLNHIKNLLGDIENIAVSTDDMSYYKIEPEYYQFANLFKHKEVKNGIKNLLINDGYTKKEVNRILYENFENKILCKL